MEHSYLCVFSETSCHILSALSAYVDAAFIVGSILVRLRWGSAVPGASASTMKEQSSTSNQRFTQQQADLTCSPDVRALGAGGLASARCWAGRTYGACALFCTPFASDCCTKARSCVRSFYDDVEQKVGGGMPTKALLGLHVRPCHS